MCRTPFKSASRTARSSVDEGSSLTLQRTSTHHEQASQRRSDHRTNDTAASVTEYADYTNCHTVRKQHCLGRCRPECCTPTGRTVHVMLRNAGAVQYLRTRANVSCSPRPDSLTADVRHTMTGILHYRPLAPNFS